MSAFLPVAFGAVCVQTALVWLIGRHCHTYQMERYIGFDLPIFAQHWYGDAVTFVAVYTKVFFRQRQVDISITFMTMPDSFLCGRLEAVPQSRALERKPATDPNLFIPTHRVLPTSPHCSKNCRSRPAQSSSLHPR